MLQAPAALLSRARWEQGYDTAFKGFDAIFASHYRTVTTTCVFEPCPRRCEGVVALLENGVPIAGYKSVDCDYGRFAGSIRSAAERDHVAGLLAQLGAGADLAGVEA